MSVTVQGTSLNQPVDYTWHSLPCHGKAGIVLICGESYKFIIEFSTWMVQIIAINNNYFHQNGVFQTVNFISVLDCGINLELSPVFFSLVKERKTRIQQKIANCISCSKGTNFLVKNVLLSHVCAHMCIQAHTYTSTSTSQKCQMFLKMACSQNLKNFVLEC